jgi:DNA invertase Pin-like site-specific DNA recombinase
VAGEKNKNTGDEKMKIFGYARVSTHEQKLDLQLDALKKYGVDEIFQEKMTGSGKTDLNLMNF